jgi:sortase A
MAKHKSNLRDNDLESGSGTTGTSALARATTLPFKTATRVERHIGERVFRIFIEAIHDFFILLTATLILWAPVNWALNARSQERAANEATLEQSKWPRGEISQQYKAVQQYNARIAASGQYHLGEIKDIFSSHPEEDAESENDAEYQSLLHKPRGVMGAIRIPEVSINLPIYHGTSTANLAIGVGHLYGTSLPVGGKSTNSVLTGHRGLPNSLLFTRLDELGKGDPIYIQTLSRTLGYRVTAVHVVSPNDTHLYKVVPGKDLVTLMTCTPYGVNTERLVITAERAHIPEEIPDLAYNKDALLYAIVTAMLLALVGLAWILLRNACALAPQPWHYDGSPVPKFGPFPRMLDNRLLPNLGSLPGITNKRRQRRRQPNVSEGKKPTLP